MTSRALRLKWQVCLAFILICQTGRRIDGHPHISARNMTALIDEAYENGELLRSEKWSQRRDSDGQVTRPVQRDTSKLLHSLSDSASVSFDTQPGQKRLHGVSSTRASTQTNSDTKIVFPTESTTSLRRAPTCHNSTFCENVTDYPRGLVNAAIERNIGLKFLESVDQIFSDIEQRIDADDRPLCHAREKVVFPKTAQNKQSEWLFIVNQENLKQGIRIELCTNENQQCNTFHGFAEGYRTICKQKYIYRELIALGKDGEIVKDQFSFPSSCCCHVKTAEDSQPRLGQQLDNQGQSELLHYQEQSEMQYNHTVVPRA